MRFVSLKTKTAFWAVLICVCTTGGLSSYLVWESYHSLRQQAQQAQMALAKTLAWEVDAGLSKAIQTISVFSKERSTVRMQRPELVREMTLLTTATEFIDALLFFKPGGKLWASSLSSVERSDFPPPAFVKQTLERSSQLKDSVLVDVYTAPSGRLEIAISAPVHGATGPSGVLVGIMHMPNHAIGNLDTARIGKSGFAYLVNQEGLAIIHPDRAKWLKDLSENPAVRAFEKEKEGVLQFRNKDGSDILAAFSPVKTSGWGVIVRQPTEECYEPATRMLRVASLYLVLAVTLSLFISLYLSNKFVGPILNLADQVRQYESGKIGPRALEFGHPEDEVGILKHAIGRMAHTILSQAQERERSYQRTLSAERKASAAERLATVGQLSAGLAHELNNPLTVILGAAEMAQGTPGKAGAKWVREIRSEAERCRRLVADLLDLAKPLRLRPVRTDLALLARETWQSVPHPPGDHRLEVVPARFLSPVDPDRFRQVFINLFRNAMEAMPQGGTVRVTLAYRGRWVRCEVKDQGTGIKARDRSKLFRPFFTTKAKGTGLGLAMVRSILQAHQGKISVQPNRPRGVRMVLEWPQPNQRG